MDYKEDNPEVLKGVSQCTCTVHGSPRSTVVGGSSEMRCACIYSVEFNPLRTIDIRVHVHCSVSP